MRGDTTETSNLDRILQQIQIQNSNPSSFPPSDMSTRTDIGLLSPKKPKSLPWWDFSNLPVWDTTLPGTPEQAAYHLTELAKDVSPVVGPYRSAVRSGIETEKAKGLLQEGKYIDALFPSIWSGLESLDASLSALPFIGAAATLPIDLARTAKNTLFTSPAQKAVSEVSQEALPGKQWLKQLEGRGVKKDELEWTGLLEFLSDKKGNIPKSEVDDFIEANKIDVQEVLRGGNEGRPLDWISIGDIMRKHDIPGDIDPGENTVDFAQRVVSEYGDRLSPEEMQYLNSGIKAAQRTDAALIAPQKELQLPGGSDYKELVLTLPNTKLEKAGREVLEFERQFNRPKVVLKSRETGDVKVEFANVDKAQEYYDNLPPQEQLLYEMETIEKKAQYIPEEFRAELQRLRQAVADAKNEVGTYTGGHFPEDNVLAHVRFNERITPEGESMLFIEEMQSDWGHAGLDKGFVKEVPELQKELDKLTKEVPILRKQLDEITERQVAALKAGEKDKAAEIMKEHDEIGKVYDKKFDKKKDLELEIFGHRIGEGGAGKIPRAPFVTDTHQWTNLGLKRMIKYAADNGFDSIAWTTGKQQGERYHKLKPVRSIKFEKDGDKYMIQAFENKNATTGSPTARQVQLGDSKTHFTEAELRKVFGDDVADQIVNHTPVDYLDSLSPKNRKIAERMIAAGKEDPEILTSGKFDEDWKTLSKSQPDVEHNQIHDAIEDYKDESGSILDIEGIEVGGEYGKFIYDKVMTEQAKKIGKKHGAKVEQTNLHEVELRPVIGDHSRWKIMDQEDEYFVDPATNQIMSYSSEEQATDVIDKAQKGVKVWTMKLTDKLKKAAKEGLPYYALVPPGLLAAGAQREQRERQSLLE